MPLALKIEPEIEDEVINIAERQSVSVSAFVSNALAEKIKDEAAKRDRVALAKSLIGILPQDASLEEARAERLAGK
jgi:hypothetical protein